MEDLISRQQAIDALRNYLVEKRCPDDGTLTCRLIENEVINKLPSVQPERKTGRWIKVNGKTAINCSACYQCSWSLIFEDTVKRFNFCPNCGAKMEGGEADE